MRDHVLHRTDFSGPLKLDESLSNNIDGVHVQPSTMGSSLRNLLVQ